MKTYYALQLYKTDMTPVDTNPVAPWGRWEVYMAEDVRIDVYLAVKAIRKLPLYTHHHPTCDAERWYAEGRGKCDCGLDEILHALNALVNKRG